jgi:hypothetical protein
VASIRLATRSKTNLIWVFVAMVDFFESPKRTILRAKHHILDLESQIAAFTNEKPWSYLVEDDSDGTHKLHKIRFARRLPDDLPSILFDAVNNLRAVLDQCAYASAIAAKSPSLKHIKFPSRKTRRIGATLCAEAVATCHLKSVLFLRSATHTKEGMTPSGP